MAGPPIDDVLELQALLARYALGMTKDDVESVMEVFTPDGTWAELAADLDEQQLLDLIFTVGTYDVLAMVMRALRIELDDDLLRWKRSSR
jgi:alkylhydroperoxidase family enzyme